MPFVDAIFEELDCHATWHVQEGTAISDERDKIASVSGPLKRLLQGERIALNLLSRSSGITTM